MLTPFEEFYAAMDRARTALELDAEVIRRCRADREAVALTVQGAWQEFDERTEEWVPTGLDRDKLAALADTILASR